VKSRLDTLRAAWLARPPRERSVAKALAALVGLAVLALAWSSLQAEQARLQKAVPLAQARLQRMQDDAAEVARLRAQSDTVAAQSATAEAINASLRSRHLDLAVTADGSDRLQVHGNAGFDETVAWLATIQQDFKLRLAALSATRAGASVRIDAVLVAATPATQ
jgi:type II secretory pathway component PulM